MRNSEEHFAVGDILNHRYQLQHLLSCHPERATWLAEDLETQSRVVIKILEFDASFDWAQLKYLEQEAATLKRLAHPAIPCYLDFLSFDQTPVKGVALVQTWVAGESLAQQLTAGRTFSEAEVKQLAQEGLEILQYLHNQDPPVIHRDIKPSNLILGDRLYFVDFGSVWSAAPTEDPTATIVGTYGYMSPEQFGGRVVPASDIYSLGATLIHLVTGTHPAQLPQKDLKLQFQSRSTLSQNFAGCLEWMTEPSLDKRLNSATLALKALTDYQAPPLTQDSSAQSSNQSLKAFWQGFIFALIRDILWGYGLVFVFSWLFNSFNVRFGLWVWLAGTVLFLYLHSDWWKDVKTKLIQGMDNYNYLPIQLEQFPQADIYTFNQYTQGLLQLGFHQLMDYSLQPQGRESQLLGLSRLFYHPQEQCFADIFQSCPPHQEPFPVYCSISSFMSQDWTLSTTNSKPMSIMQIWRSVKGLWTYLKDAEPETLLRSHLTQRQEMLQNLRIETLNEGSEGYFLARMRDNDQKRKQNTQKRNLFWALIEVTQFENNPQSQWLGDYPKWAARRR